MTEPNPADPGIQTHPSAHSGIQSEHSPPQFSPEEWQQFRTSDLGAAKAVVLLMGCIFTIGLLLYSSIDYLIWF